MGSDIQSLANLSSHRRLPLVVSGTLKDLKPSERARVARYTGPRPWAFWGAVLSAWIVIATALWAALRFDSVVVTTFSLFVIAGRQCMLALLVHEQVHYLGSRSRLSDVFTDLFVSFPVFMSLESYGGIHLDHHQHFPTGKDPDYARKSGEDWQFPMPWTRLLSLFLKDLLGLSALESLRARNAIKAGCKSRRTRLGGKSKISYYGLIAGVLTFTESWIPFLLYWILPIMTIVQVRIRLIAICEHVYNLKDPSLFESTPVIKQDFMDALFFPELNSGFHVYHHIHPGISFSNLPDIHRIYCAEGLASDTLTFSSKWKYLRFLQVSEPHRTLTVGSSRLL